MRLVVVATAIIRPVVAVAVASVVVAVVACAVAIVVVVVGAVHVLCAKLLSLLLSLVVDLLLVSFLRCPSYLSCCLFSVAVCGVVKFVSCWLLCRNGPAVLQVQQLTDGLFLKNR